MFCNIDRMMMMEVIELANCLLYFLNEITVFRLLWKSSIKLNYLVEIIDSNYLAHKLEGIIVRPENLI